jgi:hypothetical protein
MQSDITAVPGGGGTVVKPLFADVAQSTIAVAGHDVQITQFNGSTLSVQRELWNDFSDLIAEKTRWFVGRQFVFDALQAFIQQQPRGYFRITADAGLGKTAIAAELARRYRGPVYFFNGAEGRTSPDTALNTLSVQLILRYGLSHTSIPSSAGATSDYLSQRMQEAAATLPPAERIVIVVDALDEADAVRATHNWLHLPSSLPDRVYVVLTSRPFDYQLTTTPDTPRKDLVIARDHAAQRHDVQEFLHNQAARPEMRAALATATPAVAEDDFVATLADHSEGNFMYLTYMLSAIAAGDHAGAPLALVLADLPVGLNEYYAAFWRGIKPPLTKPEDWTTWDTLFRPVIEYLGVALAPVTADWLGAMTQKPAGMIRALALQPWMRFLSRRTGDTVGQETWQIVHRSFADFLAQQAALHEVDLAAANRVVADFYTGAANWAKWSNWDAYGIRYAAGHLAQSSVDAPDTPAQHERLERLVNLLDDREYRAEHLDRLRAPDALERDLDRALDLAIDRGPTELVLMARVASAVVGYRFEALDPADLFKHAEAGLLDAAIRQLSVYDVEPHSEWAAALRVIIAWLGVPANPVEARDLFNRSQIGTPGAVLTLLQQRVEAALDGTPEPWLPTLPAPPDRLDGEAIVARLAGTTNQRLLGRAAELLAQSNPNLLAGGGSMLTGDYVEFLSQTDGPLLVSLALADPVAGDDVLNQYLKVHSRYSYTTYRRGSLWVLLGAILRHPDANWARSMAAAVGRTALVGGDVEFEEAMAHTTMALAASTGAPDAVADLQSRTSPGALPLPLDGESRDRWGIHKRRFGALAEALACVLHDPATASGLIQQALALPFGFAGYQAPANLALAESILVAVGPVLPMIDQTLLSARESAHNVQDPTLCARTTARVNAMQRRWWPPAPPIDAVAVSERLRDAPSSAEFAALHEVGEPYAQRAPSGTQPLPMSLRLAQSVSQLAAVYQRPLSEFVRMNPDLPPDPEIPLPFGTLVNVPDPRFVTMLAARVAAAALADPALSPAQKTEVIWRLVPVAASNPTSLDAVLARLLLSAPAAAIAVLPALSEIAARGPRRTAEADTPPVNLPS